MLLHTLQSVACGVLHDCSKIFQNVCQNFEVPGHNGGTFAAGPLNTDENIMKIAQGDIAEMKALVVGWRQLAADTVHGAL